MRMNDTRTLSARSTFGFPFSNKSWTICSYPSSAAIKRGVLPSFTLKKIEKWETEKKTNRKKQWTKEPHLQD